ncbi:hypothetical protein BSNK01_19740 [Bacillaceae bacterium]
MIFVAYQAGGGSNWRLAAELFVFTVLYFVGTVTALWFPPGLMVPRGMLEFAYSALVACSVLAVYAI